TNAATSLSQNSSCSANTDSFTTTIVGIATNAVDSPITINGYSFTTHTIQDYSTQTSVSGTVSISAGNFLPSDYVQFAVTITNTGTSTLDFQPYTYSRYFDTAYGTIINPPDPLPITGYPAPI